MTIAIFQFVLKCQHVDERRLSNYGRVTAQFSLSTPWPLQLGNYWTDFHHFLRDVEELVELLMHAFTR